MYLPLIRIVPIVIRTRTLLGPARRSSLHLPFSSFLSFLLQFYFINFNLIENHELVEVDVCSVPFSVVVPLTDFHAGSLSAVVGTEEPIYGPEALQSVAKQTETTPFSDVNKEILRWRAFSYTNVETQTFYIMADNGTLVFVQVIYSNIV